MFEINAGKHHDHLVYRLRPGRGVLADPEIERLQQQVASATGASPIQEHALYLYAHCNRADCPGRGSGGNKNKN